MIIEFEHKIPLEDVLRRIEYANGGEIDEMLLAVQNRYSRLFPDWEVWLLSIHSGNESECCRQVENLIEHLNRVYLKK